MKLRIVGRSGDDKGKQLEELTARLLRRLGYRNIGLNVIGSGGSEVDIRAEYALPGLQESTLVLVGECKAHESTISLPDWLKFLGKVLTESTHSSSQVRGILIALSGANGNVLGAVDAIQEKRTDVQLVQGDELATLLIQEFALPTAKDIVAKVRTLTDVPTTELSLVYYEGRCHWVATFGDSTFSIIDEPKRIHHDTIELVQEKVAALRHIDLDHQKELSRIAQGARRLVVSRLLLAPDYSLQRDALLHGSSEEPNVHSDDLSVAIGELASDGILTDDPSFVRLGGLSTSGEARVATLKVLTQEHVSISVLKSPVWRSLVDNVLLDTILKIQGNLSLPESNRAECLQLLRWSPSALAWAIRPDQLIAGHTEHRGQQQGIDENDVMYFRQQLLRRVAADFENPVLYELYFSEFDLRELEISTRAKFKSSERVELDVDVRSRKGIYKAAEDLGGGVIGVLVFAEAPEPWGAHTNNQGDSSPVSSHSQPHDDKSKSDV